jgi:hypothetical protein
MRPGSEDPLTQLVSGQLVFEMFDVAIEIFSGRLALPPPPHTCEREAGAIETNHG